MDDLKRTYLGDCPRQNTHKTPCGGFVKIGKEMYYQISHYDAMEPFFMSIVSDSNHWLFISSNGGLTAGRRNSDSALFPYYTVDKIHDNSENTGSKTILRVHRDGRIFLWEPFSRHCNGIYDVQRNLYKNVYGNKLLFEEVNRDLRLTFRYSWMTSDAFGFIKRSQLINTGSDSVAIEALDGLRNLLPSGIVTFMQNQYSCLTDAYKKSELEEETGLGIFSLSSIPGDSADPAESLRATTCWSTGTHNPVIMLSSLQLDVFRNGENLKTERELRGRRSAYFVKHKTTLKPGQWREWHIVAEVHQGHSDIASLLKCLKTDSDLQGQLSRDVENGALNLAHIAGKADGLQATGDLLGSTHHFANVLFNVMRGGIFELQYQIPAKDLKQSIALYNREVFQRSSGFLEALPEAIPLATLIESAENTGDADLLRLVYGYLPLSFSRRHGDPSRPWNIFSIDVKNRDGSRKLHYQGNWRDIFQNWEALCLSFPEYVENIICLFVNTSTPDGYNPYRITGSGFDWEVPTPGAPWANIGYWGDHQLIYLLKLLEISARYHPGKLTSLLSSDIFVYADVPYIIKPYSELLSDPRASIKYDYEKERQIHGRVEALGQDGKYVPDGSGRIHQVNLMEKLLISLLAKVSNFVPGAGFWMNTQRPEWNDANNALAGYGVSTVTLYYARRFVSFCLRIMKDAPDAFAVSEEACQWLRGIFQALNDNAHILERPEIHAGDRKTLMDALGSEGGKYRSRIYENYFTGKKESLSRDRILSFFSLALEYFDHTIRLNKRRDGLYHAYHVLNPGNSGMGVSHLDEMLEGQVSVLSSGCLPPEESVSVMRALRSSAMYRADQNSYTLYPDRNLPLFLEKNAIPKKRFMESGLLNRLIQDGDSSLGEQDALGQYHFNPELSNIRNVQSALEALKQNGYHDLVEKESEFIGEIYESVFNHKAFTGRSGTFFGYEGLGCIYWHMVCKLLLALQENCFYTSDTGENESVTRELVQHYYDVRSGLGFNKTPGAYGAFPTDPYSHTPGFSGAKQPGMTGQVKEEIITRLGELGLRVMAGKICFTPLLLRKDEFLSQPGKFEYYHMDGGKMEIELPESSLAYTFCQMPVMYRMDKTPKIILNYRDGGSKTIPGHVLDRGSSHKVFTRSGEVIRMEVYIYPEL